MDDVKWTQSEIDAGSAPTGADTNTVKTEGLKTMWIKKIKSSAASMITPYDWYTLRLAQSGTAIPLAVNTYINAVRTATIANEANVASTANVTQMITRSQQTVDSDGKFSANSVYGEWPDSIE